MLKPILYFCLALALSSAAHAQQAPSARPGGPSPQKVRLSRIVVDAAQLAGYKALLREEIEASMAKEPGVLTLYAVFEQQQPTHLTILEMYASEEAYRAHVKTPHFLKYKQGTQAMVRKLELIDTTPLIPQLKIK